MALSNDTVGAADASASSSAPRYPWQAEGQGTALSTGLTVAQICAGVGLLALPYAFVLSGFPVGILGVALVAFANYINTRWLVEAKDVVLLYGLYRRGADLVSRSKAASATREETPLLSLPPVSTSNMSAHSNEDADHLTARPPVNRRCVPSWPPVGDVDAGAVSEAAAVTASEEAVANAMCLVAAANAGGPLAHLTTTESRSIASESAFASTTADAGSDDELSSGTFGFVARAIVGHHGPLLVDLSLLLTLLGCATLYFITLGHMLGSGDTPRRGDEGAAPWWRPALAPATVTLLAAALQSPLSLIRDLSNLAWVSMLGVGSYTFAVLAITTQGWQESYGTGSPRSFWRDLVSSQYWTLPAAPASTAAAAVDAPEGASGTAGALLMIFQFIGMVAFSFGIPALTFDLETALARRNRKEYRFVVGATTGVVAVLYAVLGVFLAIAYSFDPAGSNPSLPRGSGVEPLVLLSMPAGALARAVTGAVAFTMLCALAPTLLTPALNLLESLVFGDSSDSAVSSVASSRERSSVWRRDGPVARAALRLAATWLCALVAVFVPCFSLIMSIVGAGSIGLVCFVLPPFFVLKLHSAGLVRKDRAQLAVLGSMLGFGLIACLSSLWVGATGQCT